MANVFTPKERESVRRVAQTKEDRERNFKDFKERKSYESKVKEERFAAIQKRRGNKPSSGGSGDGVNIEIKGE